MKTYGFASDTHINRNKYNTKKGEFTRNNLKNLGQKILSFKGDFVLILPGDIFDKFENTKDFRQWELFLAFWILDLLSKKEDLEIYIITGNHDCSNVSEFTTLSGFEKYGITRYENRLKIIEKDLEIVEIEEGVNFMFAPFPFLHENRKNGEYIKILESKIDKSKFNILISHFIVDGIDASNHEGFTSRNVSANKKNLQKFDLVLLGDNHSPYDEDGGNIFSVGSTEQHSFSEEGEEKSLLIFTDIKNKKYKREIVDKGKKMTLRFSITDLDTFKKDVSNVISKKEYVDKDVRVILKLNDDNQFYELKGEIKNLLKPIRDNAQSYREPTIEFINTESVDTEDLSSLDDFNNEEKYIEEFISKNYGKDKKLIDEVKKINSSYSNIEDEYNMIISYSLKIQKGN